MELSIVSLFSSGPVIRLIELATAVQESRGELSLDDEIRRYIRLTETNWTANWICPVYTAAAALDLAGKSVSASGTLDDYPPEFKEKVTRAAEGMDPSEYLHILAEIVRSLNRGPYPEYDQLPMAGWEFLQTFPSLYGFDAVLMDEGDLPFSGLVRRFVAAEHPYCNERAAALSAQAQYALALFPGEQCIARHLSWATRAGLLELIDTVNEHMQREHS
ncbi:hypothetical protein [Streptomyces sp. SID14515]|uniref:hypothetical protein n=1 Tax=Streptomyces sp. SID14515 TaxID=2706074 RepID=UPI0013CB84A8|nr:hypothetical protein [Streptomyces sp. SID14515]NEB40897.1 hypothetical protein [Streptomyces sp. SID14515]NEB42121.1 hypothetical protein [Streptomyces sp. SID14515]